METFIPFSHGFRIGDGTPVDNRMVYQTKADVFSKAVDENGDFIGITKGRRYRGLKIFIVDEGKEYWFRDGITNDHLVPYQPGASMFPVSSLTERDAIPLKIRSEGMEVNVVSNDRLTKYALVGGITNDHWQELSTGTATNVTYEVTITGDGTKRDFHVSHTMSAQYFDVTIFDMLGNQIFCSITHTSSTQMVLQFENPPLDGETFLILCRR